MRIQRFALHALIFLVGIFCTAPPLLAADTLTSTASGGVTLNEALNLAARNRSELKALDADLDVAAITLTNASLPPNPELGVEWDNLGGDLPTDDVRETTISLSQPIEIGGKPAARKIRSQAETLRLQHEQTAVWLEIAAEVRMAFLAVLGAREKLVLQHEAEQIVLELASITHERVAAGELAVTEEIRAEARKAGAMADTQRFERLLTEAELNLASVLLADEVTVDTTEHLPQEVAIPDKLTLLEGINTSPILTLARSETQRAAADLSLEQANSWANPAVSLAIRDIPDKDARAVAVGISIPLPLFQRNQTALAAANASAQKASANQDNTTRRLHMELIKAHTLLVAADREVRTLRSQVLSRSAEAAEAVREGFRYGKFRYSDVLEAFQNQVEIKARHLDALLELNRSAITLDRLLGKPSLSEFSQKKLSASDHRSTP